MTALFFSPLFGREFINWLRLHKILDGGRMPEKEQQGEWHLKIKCADAKKADTLIARLRSKYAEAEDEGF